MRHFILGFLFTTIIAFTYQEPIEGLNQVLVYPMEPSTTRAKREAPTAVNAKNIFREFVEEKLIQHTAALEHLVKLTQRNEENMQHLFEVLSRKIEKPKLPEHLEVQHVQRNRRRSTVDNDPPLVRFARNVPKYGTFFKNIILGELRNDKEPVAVAEYDISRSYPESRRSFGGTPMVVPRDANQPSPWCPVAILCRRSIDPVCGYDDNFGYGKFDDTCHMLQVNCYWKYNFGLVPSCKPVL